MWILLKTFVRNLMFYLMTISETMMLIFLVCHMVGVSSACTNPVLYGFLNDNFVKELSFLCPFLCRAPLPSPGFNHHTMSPILSPSMVTPLRTSPSMVTPLGTSPTMVTPLKTSPSHHNHSILTPNHKYHSMLTLHQRSPTTVSPPTTDNGMKANTEVTSL